MKIYGISLVLMMLVFGAGYLFAQEETDSVVRRWKELDQKWHAAQVQYKAGALQSRGAELAMAQLSFDRDSLTGALVRQEKYILPLQEIIDGKRFVLGETKRTIMDEVALLRRKQGEINLLKARASQEKNMQQRAFMLERILSLSLEVQVLDYALDLDQEYALSLGANLISLGAGASSDGPSNIRGNVFEEDELRKQLQTYEDERMHFTLRLKQLLLWKKNGKSVDVELEEVARALDQLDKLVDQTKRALRGYKLPTNDEE